MKTMEGGLAGARVIAALLILTSCAAPRSRNQLVFGVTFEYKSLNPAVYVRRGIGLQSARLSSTGCSAPTPRAT